MPAPRAPTTARRRRSPQRIHDDAPRPLAFDDEDRHAGRAGDPRPLDELEDEFPAARVREAGLTGGSMPGGNVTADDLAPETLLDDDPSHTPDARLDREAADTILDVVNAADIGGGTGLDEAELADVAPVRGVRGRHLRRDGDAPTRAQEEESE